MYEFQDMAFFKYVIKALNLWLFNRSKQMHLRHFAEMCSALSQ